MPVTQHRSMAEVLGGPPLGFAVAAKRTAGARGATHSARQTILRWARIGTLVNGVRVKLLAVKRGGTWFTSEQALNDFLAATTAGSGGERVVTRSPAEVGRASRAAERKLIAAGL